MNIVLEVFDLPKYLSENNNKVKDVKIICVLNRQVNMPQHLKDIDRGSGNIPSLVDLVGVEISGKKYLVEGQVVVMLGPRAYEPTKYGKKVLLLGGTAYLRDRNTNYVEILIIFPRNDGLMSLYATKNLFREVKEIRSAYPDFMKYIDELSRMNWDLSVLYNNWEIDEDYRVCCSGCTFDEVLKSEQFVFKSEEDYKKSRVVGVLPIDSIKSKFENTLFKEPAVKQKLVCRDNLELLPARFTELENSLEISKDKVRDEIGKLNRYEGLFKPYDDVEYLYKALKDNWRRSPSTDSVTGRALFKNVLEHIYPELKNRYEKGVPFLDNAIDNNKLLDIWYSGDVPTDLKESFFYIEVAQMEELLNIAIIDYLLGLKNHLIDAYRYGQTLNVDMYSVLHKNPYYFSIIDSRLTIEDLDKLGMLYKVNLKDPEVLKFRNAAYLHNFMLDVNNPIIEENTAKFLITNSQLGYTFILILMTEWCPPKRSISKSLNLFYMTCQNDFAGVIALKILRWHLMMGTGVVIRETSWKMIRC